MVSRSIVIERDRETVWAQIEAEFRKALACPRGDLLNRSASVKTRSYRGGPLRVVQTVTDYNPGQSITIESQNKDDYVSNSYAVEALGPQSTKVTLAVAGRNQASQLRNWNYKLMGWPLLRSGTQKRLDLQLKGLKQLVEGGQTK